MKLSNADEVLLVLLSNANEVLLVLLSNANEETAADGADDGMDIDPPEEGEGPKRREEEDEDNALRDTS
jgi:hypothetical protein